MWNLDLCNSLLGPISELFQSRYEMYITVACSALRLILRNFASVIKSNVEAPLHTIGVDVSREERYHKCLSCYEKLSAIRAILLKKQSTPGKLGASFRELAVLIRSLEWPWEWRRLRPSWIRLSVSRRSTTIDFLSTRLSSGETKIALCPPNRSETKLC